MKNNFTHKQCKTHTAKCLVCDKWICINCIGYHLHEDQRTLPTVTLDTFRDDKLAHRYHRREEIDHSNTSYVK